MWWYLFRSYKTHRFTPLFYLYNALNLCLILYETTDLLGRYEYYDEITPIIGI